MNAFETLVGEILWHQGYWVQQSVKVHLTKEDKVAINRPTSPRWEIDLVAYKGNTNELLLIECKSYLDSGGVSIAAFDGSNAKFAQRFKLFHDINLLRIVSERLVKQLAASGACPDMTDIKLGLVVGHIKNEKHRNDLREFFKQKNWFLWDEQWLYQGLSDMADSGYENSVASITTKLLRK